MKNKMASFPINVDKEALKLLKKRAKDNFFSVAEQIDDIIRRSLLSYQNRDKRRTPKFDDKLIGIFSREKRGRKPKKKG